MNVPHYFLNKGGKTTATERVCGDGCSVDGETAGALAHPEPGVAGPRRPDRVDGDPGRSGPLQERPLLLQRDAQKAGEKVRF